MTRARRKAELELEYLFLELSKYVEANARYGWTKGGASPEDIKNDAFVIVLEERLVLPAEDKERDLFFRRLMRRAEARHRRRHRRSQKAENQLVQEDQPPPEQDPTRADLRSIAQRAAIKLAAKPFQYRQTLLLLVSGRVDKKDNQHLALYLKCKVKRAAKLKAAVMQALMDSAAEFKTKGGGEK